MEEKTLIKLNGFDEPMEYGKIFAESGMFPDVKSAYQGAVKVLAGRELGLSPIQSLISFYFVNGKIGILAQAMAALIKKSIKYDYQIIKHTNEECSIAFYRLDDKKSEIGQSVFNRQMAAASGLINKDNWRNYPMNMHFARALANGARWYCPDAISGFYTVEELTDLLPEKVEKIITIEGNEVKEKENGEQGLSK